MLQPSPDNDGTRDDLLTSNVHNVCLETSFPSLPGETTCKISSVKGLAIVLTNLRLNVVSSHSFFNIPRLLIDYVELKDLASLTIYCKDARCFRVEFDSSDLCTEWWKILNDCIILQPELKTLFAFAHFKSRPSLHELTSKNFTVGNSSSENYVTEIKRLNFNTDTIWRTSEINSKYSVCPSYPKLHLVPLWISDEELKVVASFRSMKRFPSVVWRHSRNGSVLARCSQPEIGFWAYRCKEDEKLLRSIAEAAALDSSPSTCNMTTSVADASLIPRKFLVVDARSYAAAVANRAKGGGCEFQEYYDNCEIKFMGLTNIHGIRKSFQSLRALILLGQDQPNWLSSLETTKWLHYISVLIRSSLVIVDALERDACSVLVHCSDGWDRTAQIVAMAELLLDPFYRTMTGFEILVEREWIDFGHKFSDRCGTSGNADLNERCPVFLQWLDCVHQLTRQFPTAFEFNELYLVKLARHVYSGTFGTFLCNQPKERHQLAISSQTHSIWSWLTTNKHRFVNYLYAKADMVLRPLHHVRGLFFWDSVYVPTMYNLSCQCGNVDAAQRDGRSPVSSPLSVDDDGSENVCVNGTSQNHCNTSCNESNVIPYITNDSQETTEVDNPSHDDCETYPDGLTLSCSSSVHTLTELSSSSCTVEPGPTAKGVSTSSSKTTSPICNAKFPGHRRCLSSGSLNSSRPVRRNSLSDALDISRQQLPHVATGSTSLGTSSDSIPNLLELINYLDTDGLVKTIDAVQQRIHQMKCEHRTEVAKLQRCLEAERAKRLAILKDPDGAVGSWRSSDCFDDVLSLPGSSGGERASLSSISNEEGWEQVQYDDVQPTRWVPDHIASHCDNCGTQFGLVVRRHHCRKCGRVFCSQCSDQCLPVPDEQLYEPVRVCCHCYERSV